ncbi:UbiX family flavin prenyltransferase [Otariodibacter sp.]|uniref:UbiX family flavin prenyltransferase n=1 Tax=Otariodibacter sp. TaxID=3030919 RepID=UPI00262EC5C8|nr:UbiX family flavin prenyltransferase [Otariodibacter sp.]
MDKQRIIVGISGASGFQYGFKTLQLLKEIPHIETHLVMSKGAELTRQYETDIQAEQLTALADVIHPIQNLGASIASGSFKTLGMIVAPCSMRTLASIAHGMSDNLLTRAADVVLKERRKLLLMVRETPLHLVHLENMQKVTQMGGIIFPPVPALYHQPKSVDEIVTHSVSRALDMFGIDIDIPRWDGKKGK